MLGSFAEGRVPRNARLGTITDRTPAVIQRDQWSKWLGEEPAGIQELKAMLALFEGDWTMQAPPKTSRARPARASDRQVPAALVATRGFHLLDGTWKG